MDPSSQETGVQTQDVGSFEQWRPAIIKPAEVNYEHAVTHARTDGRTYLRRELRTILESIAGKKVLVRPAYAPTVECGCGAQTVEVERASAQAAYPTWGSYGTNRPTMCSEMLYLD